MLSSIRLLIAAYLSVGGLISAKQLPCDSSIPTPTYFGTKVTRLSVKAVHDWNEWSPVHPYLGIMFEQKPISFCNVTLTYTHSGQGDEVHVYLWLPLEGWNGRFLGQGGGGWAAGTEAHLAPGVARGFAAVTTDAGHDIWGDPFAVVSSAQGWALKSPGNVDWQLLHDFASISLDDMTHLGKQVAESFYGEKPKYSYWNGCSTGGRQGLMQAQRYPQNYDGIVAAAPAINFAIFVPAEMWGQVLMQQEKYWPSKCESDAIHALAVEACDGLDGVKDGVVAAPGFCDFDAQSIVGREYECSGETRKITEQAARIANGVWSGPFKDDKRLWFGLNHEAVLTMPSPIGGLLDTVCDDDLKNCKGSRMPISADWIRLFLAKDPDYDLDAMSEEEYLELLHKSVQQYTSIISTNDPDLSQFRKGGGKMITWHGLADQLIFPNGTANYYERVLKDPEARDYYRYFEAPGVAHCGGGVGAYPSEVFDTVIAWVEEGKVPKRLQASTRPLNENQPKFSRPLCPYPLVAAYRGGDEDEASSFDCAEGFDDAKSWSSVHGEL